VTKATVISASTGAVTVAGAAALISAPTLARATTGAVTVTGHATRISTGVLLIEATTGALTVAPVTPVFAMVDWYPKRIQAQSKGISILGKAASIIAPIIAATTASVTITAHAASIHQARIDVNCTKGAVAVAGYNAAAVVSGMQVNCTKGALSIKCFDAISSTPQQVKVVNTGELAIRGYDAIVNATAVWATRGEVVVLGYNPSVVGPLEEGESLRTGQNAIVDYIGKYDQWAQWMPASVARGWRTFLEDTYYIGSPSVISIDVAGTANSIELTADSEVTYYREGQSWRFTAIYTNTGGTVLDVNNINPYPVLYNGEYLKGGEIVAGGVYLVTFEGDAFNLHESSRTVIGEGSKTWMNTGKGAAGSSWTVVTWSSYTEYADVTYFYGGMAWTHTIVIPANGRYRIAGSLGFDSVGTAATTCSVRLYLNGSPMIASESIQFCDHGVGGDLFVPFEYVGEFAGFDEIGVYARQVGGTATYYIGHDTDPKQASWWMIERVK